MNWLIWVYFDPINPLVWGIVKHILLHIIYISIIDDFKMQNIMNKLQSWISGKKSYIDLDDGEWGDLESGKQTLEMITSGYENERIVNSKVSIKMTPWAMPLNSSLQLQLRWASIVINGGIQWQWWNVWIVMNVNTKNNDIHFCFYRFVLVEREFTWSIYRFQDNSNKSIWNEILCLWYHFPYC